MRNATAPRGTDRYDLRAELLRSCDVLMRQQGLSIEDLGDLMGTSRSTAYRYLLHHKIPALDHFSNLFRHLREDPEEFLRRGRRGDLSEGLRARHRGAERLADLLNAEQISHVVAAIEYALSAGLLDVFLLLADGCRTRGVAAGSAPRRSP